MTVRTETRRGQRRLVIDIVFTNPDGTPGRYRKDAEVQTQAAAKAEDRRRLALLAMTGSPEGAAEAPPGPTPEKSTPQHAPAPPNPARAKEAETPCPTFREVVAHYLETYAPTKLKASTLRGYKIVLDKALDPVLGPLRIDQIGVAEVMKIDAKFAAAKAKPSTRRNVQAVLGSVLGFAVEVGLLAERPKLPKRPKVGRTVVKALSPGEVEQLLAAASPPLRRAFMLAAFAGLRAGEIRGLRWKDVDMKAGHLVISENVCRGVVGTPKSGHQRLVPLVERLREELASTTDRPRDAPVSQSPRGGRWREFALTDAFRRACVQLGLVGWRFHDLRHFFVTSLFLSGAPATVVQALAGHSHLSTTQRYAHVGAVDLRTAMEKLGATEGSGFSR